MDIGTNFYRDYLDLAQNKGIRYMIESSEIKTMQSSIIVKLGRE